MSKAYEAWHDPYDGRTMSDAEELISELERACIAMLECTGGSKHWNGKTHDALVLMEEIIDDWVYNE